MKATLDKKAQALVHGTCNDRARPILDFIFIKNKIATVADGYMLAFCKVDADSDDEMLIHRSTIIAAQRATSKNAKYGLVFTESNGITECEVAQSGLEGFSIKMKTGKPDTKYPEYLHLLTQNSKREAKGYITLSTGLLKKLCAIVGDVSQISFKITGDVGPTEFVAGDIHGLIMPIFKPPSQTEWYQEDERK